MKDETWKRKRLTEMQLRCIWEEIRQNTQAIAFTTDRRDMYNLSDVLTKLKELKKKLDAHWVAVARFGALKE